MVWIVNLTACGVLCSCLSHAGDTYDMGGGYYLYDTCGNDLLALDPRTNFPMEDVAQARRDLARGAAAITASGFLMRACITIVLSW